MNDIMQSLLDCKTDEEIKQWTQARLNELNNQYNEEKVVGQSYQNVVTEFLSDSIHYKAGDKMGDKDIPDLKLDDFEIYYKFAKQINKSGYNSFDIFTEMFYFIYKELPALNNDGFEAQINRGMIFMCSKEPVSIKEFIKQECCVCADKAAQAHNLFKMLGIESTLVSGTRDWEPHAYNIEKIEVGPNKFATFIFDPSFSIDFHALNNKIYSYGFFRDIKEDDYKKLLSGEPLTVDMQRSIDIITQAYGLKKYGATTENYQVTFTTNPEMTKVPEQSTQEQLQKEQ